MAISREQVERFRAGERAEEKAAVGGLPPAYLQGFEPSINSSGQLTVGAGVASVFGQAVYSPETVIGGEHWFCLDIPSFTYYLYIERTGKFQIDVIAPEYISSVFEYAHPTLGWRFIMVVKLDTDGYFQWANRQIDVSAENLTFTKSVGTQSNQTPVSGDVRAYLGKDPEGDQGSSDIVELAIKENNGESWVTRGNLSMRSGGNVADMFVSGFSKAGESVLSSPGLIWKEQADSFGSDIINGVAYGNGSLVACGENGKIAYSTDGGVTWTQVASPGFGTDDIKGVGYGNGVFVAVANTGKIGYSTDDGVTWTQVSSPGFNDEPIYSVVYGNGVFVASGHLGKIAYSTDDGVTWTQRSSSELGTSNLYGLAYGNGVFVTGGLSNVIGYSTDNGVTWKSADSPGFGANHIYSLIYGGGVFVAGADGGKIAYSTDNGVTWTHATPLSGSPAVYGIAYGGGVMIAVGGGGTIVRSTDGGKTWGANVYGDSEVTQPFGTDGFFLGTTFSPDEERFVVVGYLSSDNSGIIATSDWLEAGSGVVEREVDTDGQVSLTLSTGDTILGLNDDGDLVLSGNLVVGGGSAQAGYELTVNGDIYAGGDISAESITVEESTDQFVKLGDFSSGATWGLGIADTSGNIDRVLIRYTGNDIYVGDIDDNGGDVIIRAGGTDIMKFYDGGPIEAYEQIRAISEHDSDSYTEMASGGSGAFIRGYSNSGASAFLLRTYAISNVQLTLSEGGIDLDGTPRIYFGTSAFLERNGTDLRWWNGSNYITLT